MMNNFPASGLLKRFGISGLPAPEFSLAALGESLTFGLCSTTLVLALCAGVDGFKTGLKGTPIEQNFTQQNEYGDLRRLEAETGVLRTVDGVNVALSIGPKQMGLISGYVAGAAERHAFGLFGIDLRRHQKPARPTNGCG